MAVQTEKPRRPMNVVLRSFAHQSVQRLQDDFRVQKIWPYEIYPGFAQVNAQRRARAMRGSKDWYATGEGIKSFHYEVMSSSEGVETIRIEFLDHLRFVDMGTAGGHSIDTVERSRKARYNKRYVKLWDVGRGEAHRPSIMREMRHLAGRMQRYIQDFYGRECEAVIYRSFSGLKSLHFDL